MSALGYQGLGFLAVQCFQPPLFVFMVPLELLWANCDTFADTLILNQISCSCQELELCFRIEDWGIGKGTRIFYLFTFYNLM